MMRWIWLLALAIACGESTPQSDAGVDAGLDGGRTEDAESHPDTGTELDAGASDAGTPDSGPEPCPEEGAMRSASCGNCGMGQELCTDGVWVATGPCLGEGECAPGALEEEDLPMCAAQTRICMDGCEWSAFEETTPAGECEPGETRASLHCEPGFGGEDTCSADCGWELGTCESPCPDLRTSPRLSREVCVPAGPFIRGEETDSWSVPEAEIFLSTYAIDRHVVTNARFRECVDAGVCEADPRHPLDDDMVAVRVNRAAARAFCEWDGGRRLPTDAEWQKAERGPAPRHQTFVMGDEWDCDVLPNQCPGETVCVDFRPDVGTYPGGASFYGMEDGEFHQEWVNDDFDIGYYESPESRVDDPQGPEPGDGRGVWLGGTCRRRPLGYREPQGLRAGISFRCARSIGGE